MAKQREGGGPTRTQQAAKFLGVSVLAGAVLAGIALPAAGALGLAAKTSVEGFDDIPANLRTPPLSQRTTILDSDGGEIASVYSRDRTVVGLKDMSPYVQQAIVAIEDARFYTHGAIDLKGILRAVNKNAQSGGFSQGASTLTQQYVKNVFVEEAGDDPDKVAQATQQTLGRKVKELKYAIKLEEKLGKRKILQNYLNITFFGEQAYGVESAAQRYFSKSAKDLSLGESALLAGIVQSPTRYDPVNHPQAATARRNTVLRRMADLKDVTRAQADAAAAQPIKLKVSRPQNGCITSTDGAGFFCDYVREVLLNDKTFGATREIRSKRWMQGGLTIRTTLDRQTQKSIQASLSKHVYADDPVAGAAAVVQPGTGKILGMGQSRPYGFGTNQTQINLSVDRKIGGGAGYQPGSTFKPIIAAAALEQGISPYQQYSSPFKMAYPTPVQTCDGQWSDHDTVQNEDPKEVGPYAMKEATAKSVNTYYVQLISDMGICPAVTMAQKMGIQRADGEPMKQVPSMALGGQEMSPLTMATAYATFADEGTYCSPVAIESITDAQGKALNVPKSNCRSAMSKKTADTVNALLKGVVEDGTGKEAGLKGRDSAGKTGTTDSRYAAWFVGYTPNAAGAVWVGDPRHQRQMYNITIGGVPHDKVYGADTPGPIWRDLMGGALDGRPAPALPTVQIDGPKDKGNDGNKGKPKPPQKPKPGGDNKPGGGWHIPGFPDILGGGNGGW
ncbi:penicillin-binding protein [Streptomyces noursei ZPM]|uniref:Carboxypeptidase n=1 Tax=Streptomyces noursei TaxID=1971 RepID=A0A401R4N9_STRNR|nr:transglycosylase domain-containing protein [Streptomyces noursei]AKA05153.1 penicillin-binding protein [Streptomyces noursei ZPM]EOT04521.1 penicillin-binding protein [Streptomyces noursei CCRC 11814]EXU89074.1 penicillin-binding protein [Streptomyces noursei PD-1]UWS73553.1 transglycosylase domain-containing protein [Streptomyces noursei]GCB92604.1 carboxypeptidase [Streptomyces noursei]